MWWADALTIHHDLPFIPLHHTHAPFTFTFSPQFNYWIIEFLKNLEGGTATHVLSRQLGGEIELNFTHQHRNPFAVFVQMLVPLDRVGWSLWLPFPDTSFTEYHGKWLDDPSRQIFPSVPSALSPENTFPCKLMAISAFCSQRLSRITSPPLSLPHSLTCASWCCDRIQQTKLIAAAVDL
jgi:hypothetical protein